MESKEKESKQSVSMYGSGLAHTHSKQHAYMGRGATLQSCVGFVCLKSHRCYLGNK